MNDVLRVYGLTPVQFGVLAQLAVDGALTPRSASCSARARHSTSERRHPRQRGEERGLLHRAVLAVAAGQRSAAGVNGAELTAGAAAGPAGA